MKSRNREVNIFNMSLLDVLCGALGAFCFMMLVLFPYWKPAGATAKDIEERYQSALKEIEEINKQLEKIPGGGDLKQRLDRVSKDYQDQKSQLDQARKKAEKIEAENGQLQMRRPMTVNMGWTTAKHKVDIYVRFRGKLAKGNEQDPPDATKSQGIKFAGDTLTNCFIGPCNDIWMVRDLPRGSEYEVHYKFMDANGNPEPARVNNVFANQDNRLWVLPNVTMDQPQTSVFVGVLKFGTDEKFTFAPQPEYVAAFREANKEALAELENPPAPAKK